MPPGCGNLQIQGYPKSWDSHSTSLATETLLKAPEPDLTGAPQLPKVQLSLKLKTQGLNQSTYLPYRQT